MIVLPWPDKTLSPNARLHWSVVAKAKKAAKQAAWALTLKSGTPYRRNIKLTFCAPSQRRYDMDNLLARMKAALDGVAMAWGVDDSTFRITLERGEVYPKSGRVLITVYDDDGSAVLPVVGKIS